MIVKYLKNTTSEPIIYLNMTLMPGELYELEVTMWAKAVQNKTIFPMIANGTIIVNDGTRDLDPVAGESLIYKIQETEFNFSYNNVDVDLSIKSGQQMVVYETMEVTNTLHLDGQVVIL